MSEDGPGGAWTLEALTGDLHQDLAAAVARRGLRFVLYHEGTLSLAAPEARRVKRVVAHALTTAIAAVPQGSILRVDVTCPPLLAGGRWLQVHATADGGTILWLTLPVKG
jgi:hypothetical protein